MACSMQLYNTHNKLLSGLLPRSCLESLTFISPHSCLRWIKTSFPPEMQISHFVALGTYYQQLSLPCTNQIACLMSELTKRFMTGMYYLFSKQFTISPKFLKSCSFYKKRKVFIHVSFQRSIVTMIRYTDHKSTSNAAMLKKKDIRKTGGVYGWLRNKYQFFSKSCLHILSHIPFLLKLLNMTTNRDLNNLDCLLCHISLR